MMNRIAGGFKRVAALMMCLFIVLSQLALPVTALAQDVNMLPTLELYYAAGETTQSVFVQASLMSFAPIFSKQSESSISLAIVTPSLVISGVEKPFPITTFLPFGPRVIFTVFARISTPLARAFLASSPCKIPFAISPPFSP